MADDKPQIDFNARFRPAGEWLEVARKKRIEHAPKSFPFGISYLDDYCHGIHPTDFVLIGATTGAGKTTLAVLLAEMAAQRGKRVKLFALEAYRGEMEERLLFRELSRVVWHQSRDGRHDFRFSAWRAGQCAHIVSAADEDEAMASVRERLRGVSTYYRDVTFTAEDIRRLFALERRDTDLIVFDHIHFVDSDELNDNRALREITKTLRDAALDVELPVISVAHLRKGDWRNPAKVPSLDDFHGSSDLTKIITKGILLSPDRESEAKQGFAPTYMHIAKDRYEGACRHVARINFDLRTMRYAGKYELGRFEGRKQDFSRTMPKDLPHWARNAVRSVPGEPDENQERML